MGLLLLLIRAHNCLEEESVEVYTGSVMEIKLVVEVQENGDSYMMWKYSNGYINSNGAEMIMAMVKPIYSWFANKQGQT